MKQFITPHVNSCLRYCRLFMGWFTLPQSEPALLKNGGASPAAVRNMARVLHERLYICQYFSPETPRHRHEGREHTWNEQTEQGRIAVVLQYEYIYEHRTFPCVSLSRSYKKAKAFPWFTGKAAAAIKNDDCRHYGGGGATVAAGVFDSLYYPSRDESRATSNTRTRSTV
jgi:hypothetical protein